MERTLVISGLKEASLFPQFCDIYSISVFATRPLAPMAWCPVPGAHSGYLYMSVDRMSGGRNEAQTAERVTLTWPNDGCSLDCLWSPGSR